MKRWGLPLVLFLFALCACSKKETVEKGTGYLILNINQSSSLKADIKITDFILRISEGQTEVLKDSIKYLPEEIALPAGTYTVEAYSGEFSQPKFETPVYSGKTTVDIEAGEINEAKLTCFQANAGIKVVWSKDYAKMFSTYQAQIDCNEGYLNYLSTETRTGYFLPGTVSVSILADGQTIKGGSIKLEAKDMVTAYMQLKEAPTGNLTITITVDDGTNGRNVDIIVDPGNPAEEPNSETNPYNIAQAIAKQGENGVWVTGYIVGANTAQNFIGGSTQNTVLVLADNAAETNYTKTILVQLPAGPLRNALNLLDNSGNLHKKVVIKGDLGKYSSRAGLVSISAGYIIN